MPAVINGKKKEGRADRSGQEKKDVKEETKINEQVEVSGQKVSSSYGCLRNCASRQHSK